MLGFDLANDNGGGPAADGFSASLNGLSFFNVTNLPVQDYARETFTFVASAPSTLLSFSGYNDFGYLQLDDVSITAVPEPATLPLMFTGLIALGASVGLRGRQARPKHEGG